MARPTKREGQLPPLTAPYADTILCLIADVFGYSRGSLLSRTRDQDRALIRQLVIWLLAETSDASLADFAHIVGRSDHGTAAMAIEKINKMRESEPGFKSLTRRLLERAATARDCPKH
jgi:chromosomal replication initiation ATPase DnaA